MNVLKLVDVLNIGVEKEMARARFYHQAAQKHGDTPAGLLFQQLAGWEGEHIKLFSEIRDALNMHSAQEQYPGEMATYMAAFTDQALNLNLENTLLADTSVSLDQLIKSAIGFEKEAILFFMEILPYVQGKDTSLIERLISEEKQHVVYLVELQRTLVTN